MAVDGTSRMLETADYAPGWPGIPARWTSSAKTGVGTSLAYSSRVWFTLSHGIVNEVYWPREDQACIRDMGFVVTDGRDYFSQEKRHSEPRVQYLGNGVPAFRLSNMSLDGRYQIEKEIVTDPTRDVLLQQTRFEPVQGTLSDYRLYVLLAPHIGNQGAGNTAWCGEYKGIPMLFACRGERALALACSEAWRCRSAGFVGASDGWQDLVAHRQLTRAYRRAENGNTAVVGEIDLEARGGEFLLALGFGTTAEEAGARASGSLFDGFDAALKAYIAEWEDWQRELTGIKDTDVPSELAGPGDTRAQNIFRVSASVLRTHASKTLQGGVLASFSIPWGNARGDGDLGGYHLIWPRFVVDAE
jgi:glucoamylase